MKKTLLSIVLAVITSTAFGQTQIGNGDMENWSNNDEPDNWNSFLTGSGTWAGFASDQCDASTDIRPGSSGSSSCRIWSTSTLGIVANGNVTLGRIEMGSTTPSSSSNYNYSITSDNEFSEALTDHPDSIAFWAKFTPNGGNGNARMKATLHTNYNYRDPEDAAAVNEVVATAVVNYPSTGGNWMRFSVPFDYAGPSCLSDQAFILVTFTTNETPGGGNSGDEVLIDDLELIYDAIPDDFDGDGVADTDESTDGTNACDVCDYNESSVTMTPSAAWDNADCDNDGVINSQDPQPLVGLNDLNGINVLVSMDNSFDIIKIISNETIDGEFAVINTMGQIIHKGSIAKEIPFNEAPGVYFVHLRTDNNIYKFEIVKL